MLAPGRSQRQKFNRTSPSSHDTFFAAQVKIPIRHSYDTNVTFALPILKIKKKNTTEIFIFTKPNLQEWFPHQVQLKSVVPTAR